MGEFYAFRLMTIYKVQLTNCIAIQQRLCDFTHEDSVAHASEEYTASVQKYSKRNWLSLPTYSKTCRKWWASVSLGTCPPHSSSACWSCPRHCPRRWRISMLAALGSRCRPGSGSNCGPSAWSRADSRFASSLESCSGERI